MIPFVQPAGSASMFITANFSLNHNLKEFLRKTKLYRDSIQTHHGRRGHITLMAHTFVGNNR